MTDWPGDIAPLPHQVREDRLGARFADMVVDLPTTGPYRARFWARVDKGGKGGCWIWTGARTNRGYGNFRDAVRNWCAHRLAYELMVGPIPEGLIIDHLCRVRHCVNPAHLEPVTQAVNVQRGLCPPVTEARHRAQTHCKQGHPLFGDNLRIRPNGWRVCRACQRQAKREYRARLEARTTT